MMDILAEILIVFEGLIFGKKEKSKNKGNRRQVTIVVLIVLLMLIAAGLAVFFIHLQS